MKITKTNKSRQFRRMIRTVIALITIMPITAFMYLFTNVRGEMPTEAVLTSAIIIFIGWVVMLDLLLLHMLKLHVRSQAALEKMQEKGMLEEPHIKSGVESLETVFTTLTSKVKESFEELKNMSATIDLLNGELAKKMNALLTVMHIHEIYTQGRREEEIFAFILAKLKEMLKLTRIELFLENDNREFTSFAENDGKNEPLFSPDEITLIAELNNARMLDNKNSDRSFAFIKEKFKINNAFIIPLQLREDVVGFLIGGNCLDDFTFAREDVDLINIFSKNITLLWEHKKLARAVEGLEIYDPLTALYNEKHLMVRLDEEIKRAVLYQRPCGLLMLELTNIAQIKEQCGAIETEKLLKDVAKIFKEALRPVDISARVQENRIAAILIERNRRQCQVTVQKVQETFIQHFKDNHLKVELKYSIAETPIDGRTADELITFTSSHLKYVQT
jgi:diguanylate cyclase (GGDEF)-like protein